MKIKQTIMSAATSALLVVVSVSILTIGVMVGGTPYSQTVGAQMTIPDADLSTPEDSVGGCGGVETSIIKCDEQGGEDSGIEDSGIWGVLKLAIQIMTAGVGVLAVGGILWGAIMYASAGGSTEQTKKGIAVIKNTVIGLLLYVFMFAIINFLIPGGVLT